MTSLESFFNFEEKNLAMICFALCTFRKLCTLRVEQNELGHNEFEQNSVRACKNKRANRILMSANDTRSLLYLIWPMN
jgi:hypothetical protein